MDKKILLSKITAKGYQYNKAQMVSWVKAMPSTDRIKPSFLKVGDIYMHPVFNHPYILLKKKEDFWICCLVTSNGDFEQVLEKCRSRFIGDSYITKTLFTIGEPLGGFLGIYDNTRHLKKVCEKLVNILN